MKIYWDQDADMRFIKEKVVGIIGYGNQGSAQAKNIRDSGVDVIVFDSDDSKLQSAEKDGFKTPSIKELIHNADVVFILIPDEKIASFYNTFILPNLKSEGQSLVFASGYALTFNLISVPDSVNTLLLAPRMIGRGVRPAYISGQGFSALIAVGQDASGDAMDILLALSKAVGATRGGAFLSSFKEEAIIDLFFEQTGELYAFRTMFEVLVEAGFSPEVRVLDMYGSGELIESYTAVRDIGLWKQLKVHSTASQYGQEVTALREFDCDTARKSYQRILEFISSGDFSKEWQKESETGFQKLETQRQENSTHPMQLAEKALYKALGRMGGDPSET